MKKLLILILIVLILVLTAYTIIEGFQIGNFSILGIRQIQEKNAKLDETVTEATRLANSEYPSKISELNTDMKKLEEQRTAYQDMVAVSTSEDVQTAAQLSNYTIDFLWTRIGTHATSQGVNIDLTLTKGTGGDGVYNINFTATGSYVGISEFIRDIEDDSQLGFKIEQFSMKPGASTSQLQATFVCKNISIEGISEITQSSSDNNQNTDSTNTTNITDTTNTTNTTNTANTTNSTGNQTNTTE